MKKENHKNKIRIDEYFACELLKIYFPETCENLTISDSPDLQSDNFKVEVTSIQDKYQVETNSLLKSKLLLQSNNSKLDKLLEEKDVILDNNEIIIKKNHSINIKDILEKIINEKMNKTYISDCNAIFFINYCYTKEKSKENIKDIIKNIIEIYKRYNNPFQFIFLLYDEYNFCYYDYLTNNITYKNISRKQQMLIRSKYFGDNKNE